MFGVYTVAQADPPAVGAIHPYVDGKAAAVVLGLRSLSGLQESWLTELHDSFPSIEDIDRALSLTGRRPGEAFSGYDDILPTSRTVIGLYRSGLSHRSEEAAEGLPGARYLLISIYRIRPGQDSRLRRLVKLRRAHYDSINFDRPEVCCQIMPGAPSGTFMFLTPLNSLRSMDDGLARTPPYAEALRDANPTAGRKIAAEAESVMSF